MRKIVKFQLPKRGNIVLEVPARTEFLQAIAQGADVALYGIVDLEAKGTEKRDIRVLVTDFAELPALIPSDDGIIDETRYLGTVLRNEQYIVHVFEFLPSIVEEKKKEAPKP